MIDTHCPYCAMQCGISLTIGDGPPLLAPNDFPVNRGGLCAKGWTAADLLDHSDRLLSPLVRKDPADRTSPLRPASWDEALDRIVDAIRTSQHRYGPDSVGAFGGGGLTNEKAYALGKFVRVALRSASIDYNGRFCMSSAATASNRSLGIDRGLPFPLADIAQAQAVLLVGANPADALPPSMQYFDAGRAAGARHVVVDPRRTTTVGELISTCSHCRARTSHWRTGCCTSRSARAWSTRRTCATVRVASMRSGPPSRRTGRTGWSG